MARASSALSGSNSHGVYLKLIRRKQDLTRNINRFLPRLGNECRSLWPEHFIRLDRAETGKFVMQGQFMGGLGEHREIDSDFTSKRTHKIAGSHAHRV